MRKNDRDRLGKNAFDTDVEETKAARDQHSVRW